MVFFVALLKRLIYDDQTFKSIWKMTRRGFSFYSAEKLKCAGAGTAAYQSWTSNLAAVKLVRLPVTCM
jgi:hypothetical protein